MGDLVEEEDENMELLRIRNRSKKAVPNSRKVAIQDKRGPILRTVLLMWMA